MSLDGTLEIDASPIYSELPALARAEGKEQGEVLRQHLRILATDLPKITPAFSTVTGRETLAAQKRLTTSIVETQVSRVFTSLEDLRIIKSPKNARTADRLKVLVRRNKRALVYTMLKNIGFNFLNENAILPDRSIFRELHFAERSRGRVHRRPAQYMVKKRALAGYLRERKSWGFFWKAGWVPGMAKFGAKVPASLGKLTQKLGFAVDNTRREGYPEGAIGNRVPFPARNIGRILESRVKEQGRRMAKIAEVLAKKNARAAERRSNRLK